MPELSYQQIVIWVTEKHAARVLGTVLSIISGGQAHNWVRGAMSEEMVGSKSLLWLV